MQHISTILIPVLKIIMRKQIICDFIEEIRAACNLGTLTASALDTAAIAWDSTLSPIPAPYLESRDERSLFVLAARKGSASAETVWSLWFATTGGQIALEREAAADASAEAAFEAQSEPVGEGRRELLRYLAEKGVSAAQLDALTA